MYLSPLVYVNKKTTIRWFYIVYSVFLQNWWEAIATGFWATVESHFAHICIYFAGTATICIWQRTVHTCQSRLFWGRFCFCIRIFNIAFIVICNANHFILCSLLFFVPISFGTVSVLVFFYLTFMICFLLYL